MASPPNTSTRTAFAGELGLRGQVLELEGQAAGGGGIVVEPGEPLPGADAVELDEVAVGVALDREVVDLAAFELAANLLGLVPVLGNTTS